MKHQFKCVTPMEFFKSRKIRYRYIEKPEYFILALLLIQSIPVMVADIFVSQCIENYLVLSGTEENVKPNNPLLRIFANIQTSK